MHVDWQGCCPETDNGHIVSELFWFIITHFGSQYVMVQYVRYSLYYVTQLKKKQSDCVALMQLPWQLSVVAVVFGWRAVPQCSLSSPCRRTKGRGNRWGVSCSHAPLQARSHCLAAISFANICMQRARIHAWGLAMCTVDEIVLSKFCMCRLYNAIISPVVYILCIV